MSKLHYSKFNSFNDDDFEDDDFKTFEPIKKKASTKLSIDKVDKNEEIGDLKTKTTKTIKPYNNKK